MSTIERIRSHRRQHEPKRSGQIVGVAAGTAASGPDAVRRLLDAVSGPIGEVVVAGDERDALAVAHQAAGRIMPGGALLLAGGTFDPRFVAALGAALAPVDVRVETV
jgi:hypothetical protein